MKLEVWSEEFICRREKTRVRKPAPYRSGGAAGGGRRPRNLCGCIQTFNRTKALTDQDQQLGPGPEIRL